MRRSVSVFGVLALLLWLALPSVVAADNCQNMGADERDRECSIPEKVLGFFTGLGIMAGIFSKYRNPTKPPGQFSPSPYTTPRQPPRKLDKYGQPKPGNFNRGPNDSYKQFDKDADDFFGK